MLSVSCVHAPICWKITRRLVPLMSCRFLLYPEQLVTTHSALGACQNIRETCYGSKGYQCWVIVHYLDGSTGAITDYPHQVFRATLRDSSIYVLDLSSAQHSHYEPVVPWAQYQQLQLVRVYSKKLLGSFEKNLRDVNERDLSANSTVRIVLDQTAKCFKASTTG
jgi:hypothetical protein